MSRVCRAFVLTFVLALHVSHVCVFMVVWSPRLSVSVSN